MSNPLQIKSGHALKILDILEANKITGQQIEDFLVMFLAFLKYEYPDYYYAILGLVDLIVENWKGENHE
jgi:hypothetical protein